jgi:hypothetical protein
MQPQIRIAQRDDESRRSWHPTPELPPGRGSNSTDDVMSYYGNMQFQLGAFSPLSKFKRQPVRYSSSIIIPLRTSSFIVSFCKDHKTTTLKSYARAPLPCRRLLASRCPKCSVRPPLFSVALKLIFMHSYHRHMGLTIYCLPLSPQRSGFETKSR